MATNGFLEKEKLTAICDSIRAKTGSTGLIPIDDIPQAITNIQTGSKLNIHYSSTEAPTDTTQLWVKNDEIPSKVSVGSSNLPTVSGDGTLETLTTKLASATATAKCSVVGTKCYIFNIYTIQCYDTKTNTITTLSAKITEHSGNNAYGVIGTKIYLFGGTTIQCYDTETDTITTLSATLATNLYFSNCGVVGTKCYLLGGSNKTSFTASPIDTIQCYDTETDTITTLSATLATNVKESVCGVVGTKIYLLGGSNGSSGVSTIQCYDTETDTITTLSTTLQEANKNIAYGVIGTKIYLFGGLKNNYRNDKIQCYDTETDTLTVLSVIVPNEMSSMACGVVGTKFYLFGGYWYDESSYTTRTTDSIMVFTAGGDFILSYHHMFLKITLKEPYFNLISSENININIGIGKCYLGNSKNVAEEQTLAIHNGTEWQEI